MAATSCFDKIITKKSKIKFEFGLSKSKSKIKFYVQSQQRLCDVRASCPRNKNISLDIRNAYSTLAVKIDDENH
jgi:hypothetical protein